MRAHARSRTLVRFPRVPVLRWMQVAAERRRLAELDDEQLADLGLTPGEVRREASRPFWDLPRGRR